MDGETNSTGNLTGFSQGEMVIWKGEKRRHTLSLWLTETIPDIAVDACYDHSANEGTVSSRETC